MVFISFSAGAHFVQLSRRLVGYYGFNGRLRQYFSLYRAVSQRGRKK